MMTDEGNYVLRWDLHEENRTNFLSKLWRNDEFLDVTIVCEDGQIDAHKLILSASSPSFHKILLRNQYNVGRPLLYLRGLFKKDIEAMLEFMYSGETSVSQEALENFMEIANSLEIRGLVTNKIEKKIKPKELEKDILEIAVPEGKVPCKEVDSNDWKRIATENVITRESSTPVEKVEPPLARKVLKNRRFKAEVNEVKVDSDISIETLNNFDLKLTEEKSSTEDETGDSFTHKPTDIINETFNNSMEEYERRVLELVTRQDKMWTCGACEYVTPVRGHAMEHAERHIKGFVIECNLCGKQCSRKSSLRHHMRKCKIKELNATH